MKETTSFYGVKERKFTLKKDEVIEACVKYIQEESNPTKFPHGLMTNVDYKFTYDEDDEIDGFVCTEYYQLEGKDEMRNQEGGS